MSEQLSRKKAGPVMSAENEQLMSVKEGAQDNYWLCLCCQVQ